MRLGATKASATTSYNGLGDQLYDLGGARPTLDLNFANNGSLVDSVTGKTLVQHTRASSATYVDGDGIIKDAVTNLILQSEDFSSSWPLVNATVATNTATAPNGTSTADSLVETTANALHYTQQIVSGVTNSASYTLSVYAKANTRSSIELLDPYALVGRTFNLSDGTTSASQTGVGVPASFAIQSVGNGWYRCSIGVTASGTNIALRITLSNGSATTYTGDGTSGLYLWGAQLEESSTAGEYVKTTSTINSAPRFDHDPTTGESLGLLVEESRTNLLEYSEDFNQSYYSNAGVTVDLAQGTAPDGTNTANKLSGVNNSTDFLVRSGFSANTYTFSFWIKAVDGNTGTWGINWYAGSHNRSTVPVTDSWVRHSITFTSTATTNVYIADNRDGLADLTEALVWGAQLEAGSFATSYIPTEGSTVTRAADVASITGTNFSSWYNDSEGTVLIEGITAPVLSRFPSDWSLNDGTSVNRIEAYNFTSGYYATVRKTGETTVDPAILTAPISGAGYKKAIAIQANNYRLGVNGQQGATANPSFVPTVDRLNIGASWNAVGNINSTINRLTYWPTRLSNDTLQTITT